jgi:Domain of unknown function (DUF4388)
VSLLGTLEQFNLPDILKRLEIHGKSGLLVVKQGEQWVEFYFQQGRLLCRGPVKTETTLEDRLVEAGVISPQARQEALAAFGTAEINEARMAIMLLDLGCVSREALRAWASKETTQVLQSLLTWSMGEFYFEDEVPPPSGRLLVALSVSSLLASITSPAPVPQPEPSRNPSINRGSTTLVREEPAASYVANVPNTSDVPPTLSASELFTEAVLKPRITSVLASDERPQPSSNVGTPVIAPSTINSTLTPPRPITTPTVPRRIDTSFMKPEMVLVPMDLSSLREQNPQLQLTPEQWQVFTWADGRSSLQMICNEVRQPANLVCQVVGELIALGLVYLLPPAAPVNRPLPAAKNAVTAGLRNGYMAPVYAAQPRAASMPTTDALPFPSSVPLVPEHGQGGSSQPLPAAQSGGQVAVGGAYARAGRGR